MGSSPAPSAAQIVQYTNALSAVIEAGSALLGRGQPGEGITLASLEFAASAAILGNGTSPGIGSTAWQQMVSNALKSAATGACYDAFFARQSQLMLVLDTLVQAAMPSGWRYGAPRPFDAQLTRLNGASGAPGTPPAPGLLTAAQITGGALPSALVGSAPLVLHTLVGATDELESLPSASATPAAIAGANNSYSYLIAGTVPAGVSKVRIYRTQFAPASGSPVFGWDSDAPVTAGSAYPAIQIVQPDSLLRMDLQPPAWMQCAIRPGAAALYALAFATSLNSAPGAFGSAVAGGGSPLRFSATGMISPGNVALGPANGFLGIGNPPQSGLFGSSQLTALNTSAFTPGGISTANSSALDIQGFCGAMGLRFRCTSALNGTLTPAISITYYNAANGWGAAQTSIGLTPTGAVANVGDTAVFTLPSGAVVQTVSETSVSGTATSGAWVYEAE